MGIRAFDAIRITTVLKVWLEELEWRKKIGAHDVPQDTSTSRVQSDFDCNTPFTSSGTAYD
jgi:hypothetical protein